MSEIKQLISYIENIPLEVMYTKYSQTIDDILTNLKKAMESSLLTDILSELLVKALESQSFGIKIGLMCDPEIISTTDQSSNSLRLILFQFLQKVYQARKESSSTKDGELLRNEASLVGEVYNTYIVRGQNFEFLAAPLIDYLEMIMKSSSEEDIKFVVRQIAMNGKSLFMQARSELKNFTFALRHTLIEHNDLSRESRGLLLLALEMENMNYEQIKPQVDEFYNFELGNVYEEIKKVKEVHTKLAIEQIARLERKQCVSEKVIVTGPINLNQLKTIIEKAARDYPTVIEKSGCYPNSFKRRNKETMIQRQNHRMKNIENCFT